MGGGGKGAGYCILFDSFAKRSFLQFFKFNAYKLFYILKFLKNFFEAFSAMHTFS